MKRTSRDATTGHKLFKVISTSLQPPGGRTSNVLQEMKKIVIVALLLRPRHTHIVAMSDGALAEWKVVTTAKNSNPRRLDRVSNSLTSRNGSDTSRTSSENPGGKPVALVISGCVR
jgi:hypothetical protein